MPDKVPAHARKSRATIFKTATFGFCLLFITLVLFGLHSVGISLAYFPGSRCFAIQIPLRSIFKTYHGPISKKHIRRATRASFCPMKKKGGEKKLVAMLDRDVSPSSPLRFLRCVSHRNETRENNSAGILLQRFLEKWNMIRVMFRKKIYVFIVAL